MGSLALGDFEVTLIRDGAYWWDGGAVFGVVPKRLWNLRLRADELNRVPLAFNCYVIRTVDHTILVETGGGDKMDARARARMKLPPEPSRLPDAIAAGGIDPESIDIVINSHLHWDHCSGNMFEGRAALPNARYFTQRGEWEYAHARSPRDGISYRDGNYDPQNALYKKCVTVFGSTMPIALHECGPIPDPAQMMSTGTKWVLFSVWTAPYYQSPSNSVSHLQSVYTSSYVITRDEMPAL